MRYAKIDKGFIVGVVNSVSEAPDLRGPLPDSDNAALQWVGKPAEALDAVLGKTATPAILTAPEPSVDVVEPEPEPAGPSEQALAARELLLNQIGMPVGTLRNEARKIIGNDTPMRKTEIILALKRKAKG